MGARNGSMASQACETSLAARLGGKARKQCSKPMPCQGYKDSAISEPARLMCVVWRRNPKQEQIYRATLLEFFRQKTRRLCGSLRRKCLNDVMPSEGRSPAPGAHLQAEGAPPPPWPLPRRWAGRPGTSAQLPAPAPAAEAIAQAGISAQLPAPATAAEAITRVCEWKQCASTHNTQQQGHTSARQKRAGRQLSTAGCTAALGGRGGG
jgi:hypothetical protein